LTQEDEEDEGSHVAQANAIVDQSAMMVKL
jgi:hypothetical protein